MQKYLDPAQPIAVRVDDLMNQMTLDEKIAQLGSYWVYEVLENWQFSESKAAHLMSHGIGQVTRLGGASNLVPQQAAQLANRIQQWLLTHTRLKVPAVIHEECCSGYMAFGATVFPQAIGIASTWEPDLVAEMTAVIRRQMRSVGAHHALAPVLDVARDARWGRVEETFGEDPYLIARMGISYVQGLQGENTASGIVATGKHFVGYGMSEGGLNWAPPHISEREMREVFLYPFEAAIREGGLQSIMNGYHELDGIPCGSNRWLLTDVLRGEWGFEGTVVSDYFAVTMLHTYHQLARDKAEAALQALDAGIDVELPGTDSYGSPLKQAVEAGQIRESLVDQALRRVLEQKFALGVFEHPYVDSAAVSFDTPDDRAIARKLAEHSIVLLRNEGQLLPLSKDLRNIAVIGPNAHSTRNLFGDYAYPAHIDALRGKGLDNAFNLQRMVDLESMDDSFIEAISVLQAIRAAVSPTTTVHYAQGCDVLDDSSAGFAAAVEAARHADVAVLVMGDKAGITQECSSGEARDRAELDLPGVQGELVRAIYETGTPIVLVLVNGRPVTLKWMAEQIPAIVEAWLPGEEGANAIADVLFGATNPGGKLPITFPRSVGQVPIYYGHKPSGGRSQWLVDYVETSVEPQYPFGFGLSYTTFSISNLRLDRTQAKPGESVAISADVTNTGTRSGDEVVQLYVRLNGASVTRPIRELKGFQRVTLQPGETRTLTFALPVNMLAYYDRAMNWVIEPVRVDVLVGTSAADLPLTDQFTVTERAVVDGRVFSCPVQVQ